MTRFIKNRIMPVLLSVIMVISVFAAVPFTVSATVNLDEGRVKSATIYNVASSSGITALNGEAAVEDVSSLYDGNSDEDGIGVTSISYSIPEGLTPESIKILFQSNEHNTYGVSNTVGVTLQTGENNDSLSQSGEQKTVRYAAGFVATITGKSGKVTFDAPAPVAEVRIFVQKPNATVNGITDLTAKALYHSQKVEWVSTTETEYTVKRKVYGSNEDPAAVSGTISHVTYNNNYYYTLLDEVGTDCLTDYEYTVYSGDTLVGTVYALEDCSVTAVKRNALLNLDYGPEGRQFEGGSGQGSYYSGSNNSVEYRVALAKIQTMTSGTFFGMVSDIGKTDNLLFQFKDSTSDYVFGVNRSNDQPNKYRMRMSGNIASEENHPVTGSVPVSFGSSITNGAWNAATDGDGHGQASSGLLMPQSNAVHIVVLGGLHANDHPFQGILYNLMLSEETYTYGASNNTNAQLNRLTKNSSAYYLAKEITEATEFINSEDSQHLYTEETIQDYNDLIDRAEEVINEFKAGKATEAECQAMVSALQHREGILWEDRYHIIASVENAERVEITVSAADESSQFEEVSAAGTATGESESVTATAIISKSTNEDLNVSVKVTSPWSEAPVSEWTSEEKTDLTAPQQIEDGGNIFETEFTYNPRTFSRESSHDDIVMSAYIENESVQNGEIKYEAGADDNTLKPLNDSLTLETLQGNARANTEQNDMADSNHGANARFAFDGDKYSPWAQRYGVPVSGGQRVAREDNKINGEPCEPSESIQSAYSIETYYNTYNEYPWLQTGFDSNTTAYTNSYEGEYVNNNDAKLLGGISYTTMFGRNANDMPNSTRFCAQDIEVWLSNNPDMKIDEDGVPNYTVAKIATVQNNDNEQLILFNTPIEATFVRVIFKSAYKAHGDPNGIVGAGEITLYEYVGAPVDIPVQFKYVSEDGTELTDEDLPPIDGFNVPYNVLLAKDTESAQQDANITTENVQEAFINSDYGTYIDSLKYDYTINGSDEVEMGQDGTRSLKVRRSAAGYDLTYTLPGENSAVTISDVPYGELFTDPENESFTETEGLVTAPGVTYWTDTDTGDIICTDPYFSLVSAKDMTVTAHTDSANTDVDIYIPDPVVSKTATGYKIEIPVKLINAMHYDASVSTNHGMVINTDIEEFGLVIDKNGDTENIAELLGQDGGTDSLVISKAYGTGVSSAVSVNNKGRYLHTLRTSNPGNYEGKKVYAFVKVDGSYVVSGVGRTLTFPGYTAP